MSARASDVRCLLIPCQCWFKKFDPEEDKTLKELQDIMYGKVGAVTADNESLPAVDYHSKFLCICQSEDAESLIPIDDDMDSYAQALETYNHLNIMEHSWTCAGMGKIFGFVCVLDTYIVYVQAWTQQLRLQSITNVAAQSFTRMEFVSALCWRPW